MNYNSYMPRERMGRNMNERRLEAARKRYYPQDADKMQKAPVVEYIYASEAEFPMPAEYGGMSANYGEMQPKVGYNSPGYMNGMMASEAEKAPAYDYAAKKSPVAKVHIDINRDLNYAGKKPAEHINKMNYYNADYDKKMRGNHMERYEKKAYQPMDGYEMMPQMDYGKMQGMGCGDMPMEMHHKDKMMEMHHNMPMEMHHKDKMMEMHHNMPMEMHHKDKMMEMHHNMPMEMHHKDKMMEMHHNMPMEYCDKMKGMNHNDMAMYMNHNGKMMDMRHDMMDYGDKMTYKDKFDKAGSHSMEHHDKMSHHRQMTATHEYDREALMHRVMMMDFVVHELALYLDTHPNDMAALEKFDRSRDEARLLRMDYENFYGPITYMGVNTQDGWTWMDNPWPWDRRK